MSSDIFKLIPTDARWQPNTVQAGRARDLLARLAPASPDRTDQHIELCWHAEIEFVDCGSNLETITCPRCRTAIDTGWWSEQLSERYDHGFADLTTTMRCCRQELGFDELDYDWPCGFARFAIELWNPDRERFSSEELAELADALGHEVHLIVAHI